MGLGSGPWPVHWARRRRRFNRADALVLIDSARVIAFVFRVFVCFEWGGWGIRSLSCRVFGKNWFWGVFIDGVIVKRWRFRCTLWSFQLGSCVEDFDIYLFFFFDYLGVEVLFIEISKWIRFNVEFFLNKFGDRNFNSYDLIRLIQWHWYSKTYIACKMMDILLRNSLFSDIRDKNVAKAWNSNAVFFLWKLKTK